ncbi:hypothetical protein RO3G_13062 [Rhizopus delemar RA 99-880]|uniref:Uncharacterized protein n=1 Tax=Rhizopus delemar (strain RA 99-880 / ATCC MYA-4621 / FGSC 9543 / NRRL 43880) TaxID=246409 RepID=I1CIS1_RHIO9|nr:hypothetical protein RO3G_13062 [Rhizopus delemar RA 99-880]|eukprot:EIE88351.1 hypothetical protein RO3G_13062 [Rhizopus delemar RA 99-880]
MTKCIIHDYVIILHMWILIYSITLQQQQRRSDTFQKHCRQTLGVGAQYFKTILLLLNNIIHKLWPFMLIGNSSLSTFVQILNARYDKGSDLISLKDVKACAATHLGNT